MAKKDNTSAKQATAKKRERTTITYNNKYAKQQAKATKTANKLTTKPYKDPYAKDIKGTWKSIKNYGDYTSEYEPQMRNLRSGISNYGTYTSKYQDQIDDFTNRLLNNEYDPNTDPTYQYYRQEYTKGGQQAMANQMAQAAALSGGYGNSYASSVGQQTYNQYMSELANKIPELQQAAFDMYNTKLNTLRSLDETDYGRWNDTLSRMYNELGMYSDADDTAYSRWAADRDNLYNRLSAVTGLSDQRYGRRQDKINNLLGIAGAYGSMDEMQYNKALDYYAQQAAAAGGSGGGSGGGRGGGGGRSGGRRSSGSSDGSYLPVGPLAALAAGQQAMQGNQSQQESLGEEIGRATREAFERMFKK